MNCLPWTVLRRISARVALIAGFCACAALHAQTSATGTITGRVFNPATGEYVRNAEVRLQGTERLVATENDGSFRIDNVPAGPATITVTYTGYRTASESLSVAPGQTATREINLVSAAAGAQADQTIKMGEFVVSSDREGNAKAIMAQRRNMNISTSVASDVFGDVSEGNVGEFLKYLPGVDVEYVDAETRGPRLGGLSPEYVGVTMDGASVASADAFGSYNNFINGTGNGDGVRSVGFEQMSLNSIESIEVSRTTSADMDASSPAGSINLKMRRGFDRKGRRVDWQFSITGNSDDFKWAKTPRPGDRESRLIRPSWKLDYSDVFMDRRLGVSLGLSQSKVLVQQQSVTHTYSDTPTALDPRPMVVRAISFGDGPKFLDRDAISLNLDFKASSRLVLMMNTSYSTYSGATFSRSLAFTAANGNANVNNGRQTILGNGLTEIRTSDGVGANTVKTVSITGGQNFDKKTKTITVTPRFEYTLGNMVVDGMVNFSRSKNDYVTMPRTVRNYTVNNPVVDFVATRPSLDSNEWTIVQTGGPDWSNLANYTNPRTSLYEDRGAFDKIYEAAVNLKYHAGWELPTFFKFGGKLREHYKTSYSRNGANAYSYVGPGGNTVNPTTGAIGTAGSFANFPSPRPNATRMGNIDVLHIANLPVHVSRDGLADAAVAHPEWFVSTSTVANYEDAYYGAFKDFKESVPAAYGLANTRAGKLQLQGGLRWEHTETQAKEFDPLPASQLRAQGIPVGADGHATTRAGVDYQYQARPRVKRVSTYDDLFPSFSAKYSIRPDVQAQFGYSHTIRRPAIGRLAGIWDVDDSDPSDPRVTVPNPNLEPERSDNYTARLAYYFEPVGSLTFLVSQNDISNSREDSELTAEEFGYGGDPQWGTYIFETSTNAEGVTRFRNMEVGYNQQLAFLPGPLKGLNLNINYTRTYANTRKPGTLPHQFKGGLSISFWRVRNLRLGAIWQDDAQWTTTEGRFQRHNIKFDLSGDIRITPRIYAFFAGRNILNEPRTTFDPSGHPGFPAVQQGYFNYGTNWVFGVKGNF